MKKETIIIGLILIISVMVLIILSMLSFFAYNYVQAQSYQQGFQDANILINQQILNNLQNQGFVPFSFEIGNETIKINLVPYQN